MQKKAIIIGAGVAGLATSIRLAKMGYAPHVFEANSYPGGKLAEIRLGPFRFDAGPSLFTMPHYVEELFELCQVPMADYFQYHTLDITCQYFFSDGTAITAWADIEKLENEVALKLGADKGQIHAYLDHSRHIYEKVGRIFLEKSLHKASTWLSKEVAKALLHLPSYGLNSTLHRVNKRWFSDPRLVQLFDRYATYNGSSPYQAPGILQSIPHLEHGIGAFLPKGGMHQITLALKQLADHMGVRFHFEEKVEAIKVENKRATGVITPKGFYPAQVVVSNMDIHPTYTHLMPQQTPPKRILNQERSSSALIFYWGIRQRFSQLDVHNIFFAEDYEAEFAALFKTLDFHPDPTVYINITSKKNPEDAPENAENWFVMVNVPADYGQDWDREIPKIRQRILQKIGRQLGVDIAPLIQEETMLDPRGIAAKTGSFRGSLYGTSSNSKFAAFLRHPNFTSDLQNLYFCGGSVHPGGGIPLCLLSARIVADNIV
jgi:phytoene desaturase